MEYRYIFSDLNNELMGNYYISFDEAKKDKVINLFGPNVNIYCGNFLDDFQLNNKFFMHYTRGTTNGQYLAGLAESLDGVQWKRIDSDLGINLSESGWDAKHLCYPAVITAKGKTYMFYNGNDMGNAGFGYAELELA
jgi:hypothetical protein